MSPCRTLQWRKPRALDAGAREQQHVERKIDAEPALERRAEHFEDAAGAGAEIEQRAERLVGERIADRLLHRLVRHVQLADAVPLRGMRPEIVLGCGGALRADRGEPVAVAGDDRILGVEPGDQRARKLRAAALLGHAEERPGAFAEALDQAGLDQEPEMPRDARLRLAENLREVGHRQLGLGQQNQHAQPRVLARRLEGGVEGIEGKTRRPRSWEVVPPHKDIFMR